MTQDQIDTFHLYNTELSENGIYIIEDIHTSFLDGYINSEMTTYDWLMKVVVNSGWNVYIWQKDENKNTDSMTALITRNTEI
jgi:hypothetical protein